MTTRVFKILLAYSDHRGAHLARQTVRNLRKDFGPRVCLETAWNTELFRSPKLRMLAALEAAEADLIIIAAAEGDPLPSDLSQWLDLWRHRSRPTEAALVALLQRPCASAQHLVREALHHFAMATGLNFLCHSRVSSVARPHPLYYESIH